MQGLPRWDITSLIIQLISGGGTVGTYTKDAGGLGPHGNTIGGSIGGQLLHALLGLGSAAAASGPRCRLDRLGLRARSGRHRRINSMPCGACRLSKMSGNI